MSKTMHKLASTVIFAGVATLSIAVFAARDSLRSLGLTGCLGVFAACALANATVLLPAPGILVCVAAAAVWDPMQVGVFAGLGAALGETTAYILGRTGGALVELSSKKLLFLRHHRFAALTICAFVPLPLFDVAGMWAGASHMNYAAFLAATALGKVAKMLLYANFFNIDMLNCFVRSIF
jgi:uncharacterized membrane protein YdjX (TVP38/TMEM64 family)